MSHQGNGSEMSQAYFRKFHGMSWLPYLHTHQYLVKSQTEQEISKPYGRKEVKTITTQWDCINILEIVEPTSTPAKGSNLQ
jgi:hypothetical protein